jgi:type IV pilus assembly protein PilE
MPKEHRFGAARGFTLIEVMIVLIVIGILAALAYPSYSAQIVKSRRSDAKQALVELAQKLERYYTETGTYVGATLGAGGIYGANSAGGYYSLAITAQTANGFTITATPTGKQVGDACGSFGYDQAGSRTVSGGSLSAASCW